MCQFIFVAFIPGKTVSRRLTDCWSGGVVVVVGGEGGGGNYS